MKFSFLKISALIMAFSFFQCKQESARNQSDLTQGIWTSDVVQNYCTDSLKFKPGNLVTYYSCEVGWHYDGFYSVRNDTIEVGLNRLQLESAIADLKKPTTKYLLRINNDQLEWLKIEHLIREEFEEVEKSTYNQLSNWKINK